MLWGATLKGAEPWRRSYLHFEKKDDALAALRRGVRSRKTHYEALAKIQAEVTWPQAKAGAVRKLSYQVWRRKDL